MIVQAVLIPLLQALITGGFILVLVNAGMTLIGWPAPYPMNAGKLVGAFVALFSWLSYIDRFYKALMGIYMQERKDKQPRDFQFKVPAFQANGHEGFFLDLPFDQEKFAEVCKFMVRHDLDFSQAGLSGPGKPLSRSEFQAMRAELIGKGLAQWKNRSKSQSTQLTPSGRGIVKHYAR